MAKLMLVEDDNNLREIYEARLQAEGYTIITARDGEEALVVAKAEKPDLIISDVMMPKISGFEMLDILRNTDGLKEVKVIMLTALGQNDDQQRADRLGADRYLVKSQVTLEDIVKVTHELLGDSAAVAASATTPAAESPAGAADPSSTTPEPTAPASDPVVAQPTPITVNLPDEPVTPPAPTTEMPKLDVASTAQEAASVKAEVEDFVVGATEAPSGAPRPPLADPPVDEPDLSAPATSVIDPPPAISIKTTDDDTDPVAPASDESTSLGSRKVIAPLDDEPKKDLDTLVALEDARDAAAKSPATEPVIDGVTSGSEPAIEPVTESSAAPATDTPTGAIITPTNQPPNAPGDSSNIAL